jgi:hypothetical protein
VERSQHRERLLEEIEGHGAILERRTAAFAMLAAGRSGGPSMPRLRTTSRLVGVFSLLLGSGCFEDPVAEFVRLDFLPGHTLKIAVRVELHEPTPSPPALGKRLSEARRELLAGEDDWSRRFAELKPEAERRMWSKALGSLDAVIHEALVSDPQALHDFFADTALAVDWRETDGRAELVIQTLRPSRANARETQSVEAALDAWAGELSTYFARAQELDRYLAEHPERARACYGHLVEEDLDQDALEELSGLNDREEGLVKRLGEAMKSVAAVLVVGKDAARSLDEESHRVFDPFPARFSVRVPGPLLEVEGFVGAAAGAPAGSVVRARGVGLWDALASLRGRWLAPDPLALHVAHQRAAKGALFDLDAMVTAPRRALTPSAQEIRAALTERLRPEPTYRLVWSTVGLPESPDAALREAWRDPD